MFALAANEEYETIEEVQEAWRNDVPFLWAGTHPSFRLGQEVKRSECSVLGKEVFLIFKGRPIVAQIR